MRKATESELKMLREFGHHFLGELDCWFCQNPLLEVVSKTFGHRAHPPITAKLTIHHENENHDDNRPSNRKPCHQSCHKTYHAMRIMHGVPKSAALAKLRARKGGR